VSLYGDALSAVRSIVLIDERVKSLADKVDRIAVHLDHLSTRVTRLETIIEIARPDSAVLRIAPEITQMTRKRVPKGPTE
jgi:hypothetical protein